MRMRLAGILSALILFLAGPAQADDEQAPFAGSFRYAGSSTEEAVRRDAIDRGVSSFFFAIRGIARSRLSEGTKIDPWVAFSFPESKIRIRVPSSDAVSPANGAPVDFGSGGDRSKLSQRIQAGKITQAFVAPEGQRLNEWTLSADSRTLRLKVTVSSPKLSHLVVYTLTYQRIP